jgi:hypothetical protein
LGDGFKYARRPSRPERFDRTAHDAAERTDPSVVPPSLLELLPDIAALDSMEPELLRERAFDAATMLVKAKKNGNRRELADAADEILPLFLKLLYGGAPATERVAIASAIENGPSEVITKPAGKISVADAAAQTGHKPATIRAWCCRHGVDRDERGRYWLTDDQVERARQHLDPPRVRRR